MDSKQQAKKIYEVCVLKAMSGETTTYREVLKYLGYKEGLPGYVIRYGLGLVWIACLHYKIPNLTLIIVDSKTGEPSPKGFTVSDWAEEAQKVFKHQDWQSVESIDWDYIWSKRKELSKAYSTRGYFG